MAFYIFARFEPLTGMAEALRGELRRVLEPTRAEPGCVRIGLFETVREPLVFYIHSEWVDEAAFDVHAGLPHTSRFVAAVSGLMAQPLQAVRTIRVD